MMNIKEFLKNFSKNFSSKELLLGVLLFGVLVLLITQNLFSTSNDEISAVNNSSTAVTKEAVKVTETGSYKKELENQLKDILETMDGVGSVKVMIYLGNGEEKIPVFNESDSTSVTEEKDTSGGNRTINQSNTGSTVVMKSENGVSEPFVVKINNPDITGIAIVAEGARKQLTKLIITKTVMDIFEIPQSKISVYPMKK